MQTRTFAKLSGEAEVDETFIGGLARNMHKQLYARKITGGGGKDKTIVVGHSPARQRRAAFPGFTLLWCQTAAGRRCALTSAGTWRAAAPSTAANGADTPALSRPTRTRSLTTPSNTSPGASTPTGSKTSGPCASAGLKGTDVCPQAWHLFRYLDERAFTFNERGLDDLGRMHAVVGPYGRRRVTYAALTGHS